MPHHRLGALAYAFGLTALRKNAEQTYPSPSAMALMICARPNRKRQRKERNKRNAFEPSRKGIIQLKASVIKKEDGMRMLYNRWIEWEILF